jgi:hypothetical protein
MISNNETKQIQAQDAVSKALTKQFKGFNIRIRPSDGYIHATDMCKVGGKRWALYNENKRTKAFIKELSGMVGIPTIGLIESKPGGKEAGGGTWIHPHIAINLAQWVSAIFAVRVADWVSRFLAGDLTLAVDVARQNNLVNNTSTSLEIATNPEDNSQIVAIATAHAYKPGEYPQTNDEVMHKLKYDLLKDKFDKMTEEQNKLENSNKLYVNTLRQVQSKFLEDKQEHVKDKSDLMKKIDALLGFATETKKKLDIVTEKLEDAEEEQHDIQDKLDTVTEKLDTVTEKLDIVLPDRVLVKKLKMDRRESIILIEDTEPGEQNIDMYVMKRKNGSIDSAFRHLNKKYGGTLRIVKKIQQPNSRALWDLVEEKHKFHILKFDGSWFRLISITKDRFYASIDEVDYERKLIS